jgi:hypothetical protein
MPATPAANAIQSAIVILRPLGLAHVRGRRGFLCCSKGWRRARGGTSPPRAVTWGMRSGRRLCWARVVARVARCRAAQRARAKRKRPAEASRCPMAVANGRNRAPRMVRVQGMEPERRPGQKQNGRGFLRLPLGWASIRAASTRLGGITDIAVTEVHHLPSRVNHHARRSGIL